MHKGGEFNQPKKFKNKYRIASTRLPKHDYSSDGYYFITICTKNRAWRFGDIADPRLGAGGNGSIGAMRSGCVARAVETGLKPVSTDVGRGKNVKSNQNIPPAIDPIRSIQSAICISCWNDLPKHYPNCVLDAFVVMPDHVHLLLGIDNRKISDDAQRFAVSEIIRGFKTFTARKINECQNTRGEALWQSRFYDRIIYDEYALARVREYIANNPLRWEADKFNSDGIGR